RRPRARQRRTVGRRGHPRRRLQLLDRADPPAEAADHPARQAGRRGLTAMARPAPLPAHLALRIALAARALRGIDTAHLLRALIAAVGEPIAEARLRKLRAARLQARLQETAPPGAAAEIGERALHCALGLLKGRGVQLPSEPPPPPEAYRDGEFAGSVRIACASDNGARM